MAVPTSTRFYRYKVESLDIIFPSEGIHYSIDGKLILRLMIERDYENDMFPVMKLDLSLDTELYYKIVENNTTVKFRLRLQKYIYDRNNTLTMKKDVINDVFVVFMDENTPFLNKSQFKAGADVNSTMASKGKTPVTVGGNEVSFYLFKEHDMMYSKKIVNAVITKGTVTDSIAYLLSSTGFTKTLMTPLENNTSYNEIVIPPLTVQGNLIYLENQFGFYYRGALIFFDIDCLYIIKRIASCTAWRRGEYPNVIFSIKDSKNAEKFSTGSYFDDKQTTTFINVKPEDITMSSGSIIRDQVEGNHRLIINPIGAHTSNLKASATRRGDGTYKVMVNKYNNPFINSAEMAKIESDGQLIDVALQDIDVDTLTPNKAYSFKFEDGTINKQYGGNYRLSKSILFINNEGDHFKAKATASFKQ